METKTDLFKQYKEQYIQDKSPVLVDIPPIPYLSVVGQGSPGGDAFVRGVQSLFGAAFGIKMARKFAGLGDYKVCPLQGQWWVDGKSWMEVPRDKWQWKLMIRTPENITQSDLEAAREAAKRKKKDFDLDAVVLETIDEGRCVQVLHVGPYSMEHKTIAAMDAFAIGQGLTMHGLHHEIYLSDPRRVDPAKLKTILRHPVR